MINRIRALLHNFTASVKLTQKMLFIGGAGLLCVIVLVTLVLMRDSSPTTASTHTKPKTVHINSANRSIQPQEVWVDRLEKEREFLNKRLNELEKLVEAIALSGGSRQTTDDRKQELQTEVSSIDLSDTAHRAKAQAQQERKERGTWQDDSLSGAIQPSPEHTITKPVIRKVSFKLNPGGVRKLGTTVDHYVPAGSFASGILTSGVVAKTSVEAAGNPQPIHMEITDFGTLPRNFKSDLQACFVTGAAYGDLAAERAFVRLEKFSCVERDTGEVIEATVEGYVVGEDGANGLRGILVDRSGPAIRNAFVGGFISGMGGFLAQSHTAPLNVLPNGGVASNPLQPKQMLQAGAGQGLGNAMERYADFYIKRAEQTQPVIEIEAGRTVDIVFQKGFDLNQTFHRQSLIERRDRTIRDQETVNSQQMTGGENHD